MVRASYIRVASVLVASSVVPAVSAAGFIEGSKATVAFRNYYYDQNLRDVHTPGQRQWGQGVVLNYQSDFTPGIVGIGIDTLAMMGVRLDDGGRVGKGDASRTPAVSGLFPMQSDGSSVDEFSSLGPTLKLKVNSTEVRWGTLLPQLPVVTRNDGRLLPQTFEGAQVKSQDFENLVIIGGRLNQAKGRASSDRRGLSIVGANSAVSGRFVNEFYYAGVDYKAGRDLQLQYYVGRLEDFYFQNFLGLQHSLNLSFGKLKTDLRYYRSSSVGKNSSLSGRQEGYMAEGYWSAGDTQKGEVDNRTWSSLFSLGVGGHEVGLGFQRMTGHSQHAYLNQGDGAITSLITERLIIPFNNPEEQAWMGQYRYDFSAVGVPGLSVGVSYTKGSHIRTSSGDSEEFERDVEVSYVIQSGPAKGLGFAWRNGMMKSDIRGDVDQNRLILSYALSIF